MLVGFGRKAVKSMGRPLTIMAHLKRIIEIRSETKCRAHALIIAIARITDEPNYKAYRQGFNILPAVQHLLVTTGIDLQNGGGIHELQRFQDHFTEYKIVVYGGLDCGDIIFEGQVTSEKRINLLYDDVSQHYHVIANLTGAMAERYVCKGCNKVCRSTVSHKRQETCNDCMFIPPCVFTDIRNPCEPCNRTVRSQYFFDKHKSNKLEGKTVCKQKRNCANCGSLSDSDNNKTNMNVSNHTAQTVRRIGKSDIYVI